MPVGASKGRFSQEGDKEVQQEIDECKLPGVVDQLSPLPVLKSASSPVAGRGLKHRSDSAPVLSGSRHRSLSWQAGSRLAKALSTLEDKSPVSRTANAQPKWVHYTAKRELEKLFQQLGQVDIENLEVEREKIEKVLKQFQSQAQKIFTTGADEDKPALTNLQKLGDSIDGRLQELSQRRATLEQMKEQQKRQALRPHIPSRFVALRQVCKAVLDGISKQRGHVSSAEKDKLKAYVQEVMKAIPKDGMGAEDLFERLKKMEKLIHEGAQLPGIKNTVDHKILNNVVSRLKKALDCSKQEKEFEAQWEICLDETAMHYAIHNNKPYIGLRKVPALITRLIGDEFASFCKQLAEEWKAHCQKQKRSFLDEQLSARDSRGTRHRANLSLPQMAVTHPKRGAVYPGIFEEKEGKRATRPPLRVNTWIEPAKKKPGNG